MIYLLDSHVCISFINGRSASVQKRLQLIPKQEVAVCSVVKTELVYGAVYCQNKGISRVS